MIFDIIGLLFFVAVGLFLAFTKPGRRIVARIRAELQDRADQRKRLISKLKVKLADLQLKPDSTLAASIWSDFQAVQLNSLAVALGSKDAARDALCLVATHADSGLRSHITQAIVSRKCTAFLNTRTQEPYNLALTVLAANPNPSTKQFALEVGRWNLGSLRSGNRPTIYDEQAIQNDISARL